MIVAVDPGKMTGVVWDTEDGYDFAEVGFPEIYNFVEDLVLTGDFDTIVIENFLISSQTGKKSQAPWSLKIIGVVEALCLKWGLTMILQTPSAAKNFIDDKKLKRYDYWLPGEGHARDAARHYLLYKFKTDPQGILDELL